MRSALQFLSFALCTLLAVGCVKRERPPVPTPASTQPQVTVVPSALPPAPAASSALVVASAPRRPSIRCSNGALGELQCWFDVIDAEARAEIQRHDNRDRLGLFCNRGVTRSDLLTVASSPGNVVSLGLSGCVELDDLTPVKELRNLRTIELVGLRIRTLSPLAALPQLEVVVASNLHDLTDSDLMALSHKKVLHTLRLGGSASIVDIRAVDDMPALEILDLGRTSVKDLGPLRAATALKTLVLSSRVTDIGPLDSLDKLRSLELGASPLADLSPLRKLVRLESLVANGVGARDVTFLTELKALQSVSLANNRELASLVPLAGLAKLTSLTLSGTSVKDLTPLSTLPALLSLDIQRTPVVDVAPLMRIKTLKKLSVSKSVPQPKLDALKKALPEMQITVR